MKAIPQFTYVQFTSTYKTIFLSSVLTLLSILGGQNLIAQTQEELNAIDRIARYGYINSTDQTDYFLAKYGFKIPSTLTKQWNSFSAVRKLDYAFKSAEKAERGNGDKLLTMLSQDVASNYESAFSEPRLQPYFQRNVAQRQITFASLTLQEAKVMNLSPNIEKAILKITKYTNAGALGSIQTLMVRHFGLSEAMTYQILTTSNSELTALRRGLSKSKIPPTHKQRITNIVDQLIIDYESVAKDNVLSKYSSNYNNLKNNKTKQTVVAENKNLEAEVSKKLKSIKVVRPSNAEITSVLKAQGYTDRDISNFINSIESQQTKNLSEAFIPNSGDPYRDNLILKKNLADIGTKYNNTQLIDVLKSRPIVGGGKICTRCGLPTSFPLCLSVRRR